MSTMSTHEQDPATLRIGLLSISDRASQGVYEDKGIPALREWFAAALTSPWQLETRLIPDDQVTIENALIELVDEAGCHLVLTTGGTGPAPRDVTPEATLNVADKVTTFTASDFGRTLSSNGDGSDHGWGSHHLVVGGAVKGKAFYGSAPPVSITNTAAPEDQWHVGQGRLLPSTSVDQYAATLAKWFGVADNEMAAVLPNITHFGAAAGRPDYPVDLGFL